VAVHRYTDGYYSNDWLIAPLPGLAIWSVGISKERKMIRGIKIVSIPVRNQDVALKFYTEKMGFKVATDQPMGNGQRWIELLIPGSDSSLALFTPPGHEDRIGGFQPMTFWCDDVFATAAALKARGVELAAEPKKEVWGTMAKFKDPDGNEFVFSSRK
jgi:predicted enzyme related to lactoylglutathione lyase